MWQQSYLKEKYFYFKLYSKEYFVVDYSVIRQALFLTLFHLH